MNIVISQNENDLCFDWHIDDIYHPDIVDSDKYEFAAN